MRTGHLNLMLTSPAKTVVFDHFSEFCNRLWTRRGGRDIKQDAAKPPLRSGRGGSFNYELIGDLEPTTPSAPSKEASHHFLNVAATPPWPRRGVSLL